MLTISLYNIRVHAPHGLYPEEARRGNDFEVDVTLQLPVEISGEWPLIDYASVYKVVLSVMLGKRVQLLETLVKEIWMGIYRQWPQLNRIQVCVRKLRPPVGGDVAAAQVCLDETTEGLPSGT